MSFKQSIDTILWIIFAAAVFGPILFLFFQIKKTDRRTALKRQKRKDQEGKKIDEWM